MNEQHTAQGQAQGGDAEQVIAHDRTPSPGIDPEKLLELAKQRHHDGGVTLGWPTVIKIVEELRRGCTAAEEQDRFSRLFANTCETLGAVQEALGTENDPVTIGLEPDLVREMKEERDALAAHVERLHDDFHALVAESYGVAELHANGDVAPWDELTKGGRFEQWLLSFSDKPTTSLARRDAAMKAEALHDLLMHPRNTAEALRGRAKDMRDDYRRQAKETTE